MRSRRLIWLAVAVAAVASAAAARGQPRAEPPQLTISSPADHTVLTSKRTTIRGSVKPGSIPLDHMTLNGRTVFPDPGPQPDGSYPFNFAVTLKKGVNDFTITAVDQAGAMATGTLTLRYRLPSCSVRDLDRGRRSEFDVRCTKPIANGGFTIVVNRSGCDRGCEPTVKVAGTGHLQCSGRGLFRRHQPWESVGCEGSLAAGSTAKVFQAFRTFTIPCDAPRFKGTFSVDFGDGTRLKSRALPRYRCPARTHRRFFGLFHAGLSAPGGAGFVAELDIKDGYKRCISRVPLLIQARSGSGWKTVLRTRTPKDPAPRPQGVWESTVFGVVAGGGGGYRAVAPRVRFGNQTCASASATH
jgi:hypothetical protein